MATVIGCPHIEILGRSLNASEPSKAPQKVAVNFHEWTSVDVKTPIFTDCSGVLDRLWTSVEMPGSG